MIDNHRAHKLTARFSFHWNFLTFLKLQFFHRVNLKNVNKSQVKYNLAVGLSAHDELK